MGWPTRTNNNQVGEAMVIPLCKAAKKPYHPPSFQVVDAATAKAELETKASPRDAQAQEMLSVINMLDEKAPTLPSLFRDPLP